MVRGQLFDETCASITGADDDSPFFFPPRSKAKCVVQSGGIVEPCATMHAHPDAQQQGAVEDENSCRKPHAGNNAQAKKDLGL